MYIIINNTKNKTIYIVGGFPNVEELLNQGDQIIIISLYSNTIKVPYVDRIEYGEKIWEWIDYKLDELKLISLCLKL